MHGLFFPWDMSALPNAQEAGLSPEPVWTLEFIQEERRISASTGNWTQVHLSSS